MAEGTETERPSAPASAHVEASPCRCMPPHAPTPVTPPPLTPVAPPLPTPVAPPLLPSSRQVYYGYWQGHRVAIKLAHPPSGSASAADLEHLVREFRREVEAMSALPPHKNVLQLLAACTEPPQLVRGRQAGRVASGVHLWLRRWLWRASPLCRLCRVGTKPNLLGTIPCLRFSAWQALVTDYCAAGSLYQLLHGARVPGHSHLHPPWPQLLAICLGVAQGMSWLHRHSILHRCGRVWARE